MENREEPGLTPQLDALLENASPTDGFEARTSLAALEARLFGRRAQAITVDRFTLVRRLGSGGGGTIYRAHDPRLGRDVALKLLHGGHDAGRPEGRARLIREAQLLARLTHPNIVEVLDVGFYQPDRLDQPPDPDATDAGVFIAMEYLAGTNLAVWLTEADRPWTEIRDVFIAAGRGLAAAHAAGLVHRDFKPANVIVGPPRDGLPDVRVLDFGLGRAMAAPVETPRPELTPLLRAGLERLGNPSDVSLTMTGATLGTPAYMAPEQHAGQRADARSDQYSFCLALYEGLHRCNPFLANTTAELEEAKRHGSIAPPPTDSKVPARIDAIVRRGLAPDPADRWPDMQSLLDALDRPVRTRGMLVAAVVVVVLLAAGLGALWLRSRSSSACDDALRRLDAVWNPRQAASVRAAFEASGSSIADETFSRLAPRLDEHAAAWSEQVRQTCSSLASSSHATGALACFEEQLDRFARTVETLCTARPSVVEQAIDTAGSLDSPATCARSSPLASARALVEVATELRAAGRVAEALEHLSRAQEALGAESGPPHPLLVELELLRAELLVPAHSSARDREALASTLALSERVYGLRHPRTATIRARWGTTLHRGGHHVQAAAAYETALRDLEAARAEPQSLCSLWIARGEIELAAERPERALASFERALELLQHTDDPRLHADASFGSARAMREAGMTNASVAALASAARDTYTHLGDHHATARVDAWLRAHDL